MHFFQNPAATVTNLTATSGGEPINASIYSIVDAVAHSDIQLSNGQHNCGNNFVFRTHLNLIS